VVVLRRSVSDLDITVVVLRRAVSELDRVSVYSGFGLDRFHCTT
jgi:hypothetical protein